MSRRRAPTDLRTPISCVRSVTVTSMMFITPTPEASKAMSPMISPAMVSIPVKASKILRKVSLVSSSKLLSSPGGTLRMTRRRPVVSSIAAGRSCCSRTRMLTSDRSRPGCP